jgi:hypothetical protein
MTENLNMQRALLRCIELGRTVTILDGTKVEKIESERDVLGSWQTLHLSNCMSLRTSLLVGMTLRVKRRLNITWLGWCRWVQFTSEAVCKD